MIRFSVMPVTISYGAIERIKHSAVEVLEFEVSALFLSTYECITAYKSQDFPLEKLRKICGWVDA